jgi:hypothetical protein
MNLSFREPSTEQELKSLLDLRYGVYSRDRSLQNMVGGNDISEFDLRSLHFGAFDRERPVAYMRMVQRDQTHFAPWVQTIADHHIKETAFAADFPFEVYSPYKTWNKEFLRNLSGKKIGEAGKLAIHEDYRKDGILEHFIRAFVDYCNETHRFDSGFGVCTFTLERFYRRLGFRRADGAVPFIYGDLPEAVILQFDRKPSPFYVPDLSHRLSYQFPG